MKRNIINHDNSKAGELEYALEPFFRVSETEHDFVIQAELPTDDEDDTEITIENGCVHICTEVGVDIEHSQNGMFRIEHRYSGFSQHIPLPLNADPAKAEAEFIGRTISIHIPKRVVKNKKAKPQSKAQPKKKQGK